jgi:hypothetical protein
MSLHLAEISLAVAPGAHAVVLMDQAGWHMTGKLVVPGNMSIVALPAKCPELNPVENIWQFMRDNWLSNRVFNSYDTAARPGTSSSISLGTSWPSGAANGHVGTDQCTMVSQEPKNVRGPSISASLQLAS